jgi:hypothetical protein
MLHAYEGTFTELDSTNLYFTIQRLFLESYIYLTVFQYLNSVSRNFI